MLNLLIYFHQQGLLQVALLLGKKEGKLLEQLPSDIPIYSLGASSAKSSVIPLIQFCKKYRPKVIIGTLGASLALSLAKFLIPKNIKIINRLGNTIGAEKLLLPSMLKRKLYLYANCIIGKFSSQMVFQCQYMAQDFIRETGIELSNYQVIYNPVNTKSILNLAQEPIVQMYDFVAVGRLDIQKDYHTLIEAAYILRQSTAKFTIAILGDGKMRADLEKKIDNLGLKEHVFLLGHVKNPYPYIRQSKYLLSSSLYEGFSNVIVEALCLGTPVIASDCPGGNKETLHERNGTLFSVGNALQMANTMKYELNNYERFIRNTIAKEAQQKYTLETIANQYLQLLQS
jgi:glycosyltransferase involved in cell wall biosynthesis